MFRIKKIETFCSRFVGFVKVTDEEGRSGIGQVAPYHADITVTVLHRQVAPWLLGVAFPSIGEMTDVVCEREHKFPGSYIKRAIGGVDTALWDLVGKREGKPVVALLGGEPGRLRAYGSSMSRAIAPADEAERFRRLRGDCGFDAFKFRVGTECGRDVDAWPGRSEEIVRTVGGALGGTVSLLVDGNSGFSPPKAIAIGRLMEDHGIEHFEEPCPYWEFDQTKEVTEALKLDVAGGEQDCELAVWREMAARRIVDVMQPDVLYVGGMARAMRVAEIARAAGLPVTPHAANLTLVTLFTMHYLKAVPNAGKYLEYSIEGSDFYPWQEGLFRNWPFAVTDGQVEITAEPGWGVELDPDWLARSRYQVSELAD